MTTPTMLNEDFEKIIVFDVGARFGIHPSWSALKNSNLLATYAFDPDVNEVKRLKEKYKNNDNYQVYPLAFGRSTGTKSINLLAHKGQSSFLQPNLKGAWFGVTRQSDGVVESATEAEIRRMDDWCSETGIYPDFLKIDTEGYDYLVLEGAEFVIKDKLLGIRCEVYFQETFIGVNQFDDIFSFLKKHKYILANLDYDGKGSPQSYFCPKARFGLLTVSEAVFIRDEDFYMQLNPVRFLKAIIFLFLNNLEDLALLYIKKRLELFTSESLLDNVELVTTIEKLFLLSVKDLQYQPGSNFDLAKKDFHEIFKKPYPDMHKFYESDFLNPA